jgi:hypothetical protein
MLITKVPEVYSQYIPGDIVGLAQIKDKGNSKI